MSEEIIFLGQAGFRISVGSVVIYIDPYLSNSVAETEGSDLQRLVEIPVNPDKVNDADWILITHNHQDHCDLETIMPILGASPGCRIMCPNVVATKLVDAGVPNDRLSIAREEWENISDSVEIRAIPAAHPDIIRDSQGLLDYSGYLLRSSDHYLYHSGDTSPSGEIIDVLKDYPIHTAILPVNEKNYYRERKGIIGNMSIREAFQFAEEMGAEVVVPMHWDMFKPNAVFKEEIELLYKLISPKLEMYFPPRSSGSSK